MLNTKTLIKKIILPVGLPIIGAYVLLFALITNESEFKPSSLKTDIFTPNPSVTPFTCAKVISASSSNPGINSPGNLNYGISFWYGVGTVTPYSHLGPTGQELATLSDSNVFEQRYIGTTPAAFAVGASDHIGEQTLTIECDTGPITVYTPNVPNVSTNMRIYVARDGSTYHSIANHDYSHWPDPPNLKPEQAMVPEHLAKASPTYQANCYNTITTSYGSWQCEGQNTKKRDKTLSGLDYNPTTGKCDIPVTNVTPELETCANNQICSAGTCKDPGTSVSGGIYSTTTWTLSQSPYIVTDNVTVFPDVTLTLEPGVIVKFAAAKKINIRGNLVAEGSADKKIIFTSLESTTNKGYWGGLTIENTLGGKGSFKYVEIFNAGSALSVQCCHSGGPVTISDSLFSNNTVAVNGYAGWKIKIDRTTFENNTSAITNADKEITNSIFRKNTFGLNSTERVDVINSTFTENGTAIYAGRGKVINSVISANDIGIKYNYEGPSLTYNSITNNVTGIILNQYSSVTNKINYNNIHSNTTYNIKHQVSTSVDAKNNYWGTTDTSLIKNGIYDGLKDQNLGLVSFEPMFTAAIDISGNSALPPLNQPLSPPQNSDSLNVPTTSTLSGAIYKNTIWPATLSPYSVIDHITVFPEARLTIEPGVKILFNKDKSLKIRGELIAEGASDKKITFTASNEAGAPTNFWAGIKIENNQGGKASFKFVDIKHAQTGVSVECCNSGGPVTISDSYFWRNNTAVGGYAGWKIKITKSTFEDNIETITSADKEISHSIFTNNTYGLWQTERVDVIDSRFSGHKTAINGGRGKVMYSTINNNENGVTTSYEGLDIRYNTIKDNQIGVGIISNYSGIINPINYNNIYGNTSSNIRNNRELALDARNNYWGTQDKTSIEASIYDGIDTPNSGIVTYEPYSVNEIDIRYNPAPPQTPPPLPPITGSGTVVTGSGALTGSGTLTPSLSGSTTTTPPITASGALTPSPLPPYSPTANPPLYSGSSTPTPPPSQPPNSLDRFIPSPGTPAALSGNLTNIPTPSIQPRTIPSSLIGQLPQTSPSSGTGSVARSSALASGDITYLTNKKNDLAEIKSQLTYLLKETNRIAEESLATTDEENRQNLSQLLNQIGQSAQNHLSESEGLILNIEKVLRTAQSMADNNLLNQIEQFYQTDTKSLIELLREKHDLGVRLYLALPLLMKKASISDQIQQDSLKKEIDELVQIFLNSDSASNQIKKNIYKEVQRSLDQIEIQLQVLVNLSSINIEEKVKTILEKNLALIDEKIEKVVKENENLVNKLFAYTNSKLADYEAAAIKTIDALKIVADKFQETYLNAEIAKFAKIENLNKELSALTEDPTLAQIEEKILNYKFIGKTAEKINQEMDTLILSAKGINELSAQDKIATFEQKIDQFIQEAKEEKYLLGMIPFKDSDDTDWWTQYTFPLKDRNVIKGFEDEDGNPLGEYRPANGLILGEVIASVVRFANYPLGTFKEALELGYKGKDNWIVPYYVAAKKNNLSLVINRDTFESLTQETDRGEVVQAYLEALAEKSQIFEQYSFPDIQKHPAAGFIERGKQLGIVQGHPDGRFKPFDHLKRSEFAAIAFRALNYKENLKAP